jgi:hypothetical protein
MHYIRKYLLAFLMAVFALTSCGTQNSNRQNSNPIIPDHFELPLSYTVKANGSSIISIRFINPNNELISKNYQLESGIINEFHFDFDTPGDVHFIYASINGSDTKHNIMIVSTENFTKTGRYFVQISY